MSAIVDYRLAQSVATITMDDGKLNVLSRTMLGELHDAFDRAAQDRAVVVLSGRDGVFSAGFDLGTFKRGGADFLLMLRAGIELTERMLSFPTPVIAACSGHAIAMGLFLLVAVDYRIGVQGAFKLTANEVAIGLPIPRTAQELCRGRLSPTYLNRALLLAESYTPEEAVTAGFLDRVVPVEELQHAAQRAAHDFSRLNMNAHARTKESLRAPTLRAMRAATKHDLRDLLLASARRLVSGKPRSNA